MQLRKAVIALTFLLSNFLFTVSVHASFDVRDVVWTRLVNAGVTDATGNGLVKIGGCDGCSDASAVSMQKITAGDGYVLFNATETNSDRYVGLGNVIGPSPN